MNVRDVRRNPGDSPAQSSQYFRGSQLAFQVALEGLKGETAQIQAAPPGPRFGGKGGSGGSQHSLRKLPGIGRKRARIAIAMHRAEQSIGQRVEAGLASRE